MKRTLTLTAALLLCLVSFGAHPTYELNAPEVEPSDTTRVLCIGNSFTFFYSTFNMLQEIAWSQGHFLNMKTAYVGGYSFAKHLADVNTLNLIEGRKEYGVVFLQNHSTLPARYALNSEQYRLALEDAKEIAARVREYSPNARLFMERTWSYSKNDFGGCGSMEAFDAALEKGTAKMAKACRCKVSPIGNAFEIIREQHPEINLLYTDNHHQSAEGAYLKSCVNYLMIFGGEFNDNVSDCGLDHSVAQKLRAAALQSVAGK